MKVFRVVVVLAAVALAAFTILAQTQTRPAATPANIAIIDSSAFSDDKNGIARVMAAMQQIETKFTPLRNEIRGMRDRLNTMKSDLQKKRAIQDASMTAKQADEAEQLELQIKRKAEDAQASYQRDSLAMLDPLQKDIGTALTAYAQSRGITLLRCESCSDCLCSQQPGYHQRFHRRVQPDASCWTSHDCACKTSDYACKTGDFARKTNATIATDAEKSSPLIGLRWRGARARG